MSRPGGRAVRGRSLGGASSLRGRVAVVGLAESPVGRVPDRTPLQLAAGTALAALADAGLTRDDVDGLVTCHAMAQPFMYPGEALAEYLQVFPGFCLGLGAGGASALAALHHAARAIVEGVCDTVVVAMADSLRTGLTREQGLKLQASAGHPEFETPYGPTAPALYALVANAYLHAYGAGPEHLAAVAVSNRAHAARHPGAEQRKPLTVDDVLASRMIAEPLRLLDCSLVSDGGAAVVLTSADRARDLRQPPVFLLGIAEAQSHEHITQAKSLVRSAAEESGRRAYAMAGVTAADVDVAGIYDCFTPVVLIQLEDLGFCERGGAGELVLSGATGPGGALPVNTHGGLLSHSHPGNPGSMFHLTEVVTQLRGGAGVRQVPSAAVGLVHAQGGTLSSHCTAVLATEAGP